METSNKRKFFIVAIGYRDFVFTTLEDAMKVYNVLSTVPYINLEHKMVDKFDPERNDFSGYEYLYYIGNAGVEITLSTKEYEISTVEHINAVVKKVEDKKAQLEKQKGKN